MTTAVETTYKAPIDKVFSVFTDFQNIEHRIDGIKKIEFLAKDGRPEVGMKWRETRVIFGKEATEEMWISEINQNQSYVVEAESHGTKYRSVYTFSGNGDTTTVKLEFTGIPVTLGARIGSFMMFFLKGTVKKAFLADMEDLRRVIES